MKERMACVETKLIDIDDKLDDFIKRQDDFIKGADSRYANKVTEQVAWVLVSSMLIAIVTKIFALW